MAGNLALSIRTKAKVVPIRQQIEASRTEFAIVWIGILAFCVGCWIFAFYIGCLIGRAIR